MTKGTKIRLIKFPCQFPSGNHRVPSMVSIMKINTKLALFSYLFQEVTDCGYGGINVKSKFSSSLARIKFRLFSFCNIMAEGFRFIYLAFRFS